MRTFLQDIRFGIRMLAKNPGFTLAAVITLALGIGSSTTIFSVVNALLLRPPEFTKDHDQLFIVWENYPNSNRGTKNLVFHTNFEDIKNHNTTFEQIEAVVGAGSFLFDNEETEQVLGNRVSSGFLPMLGVTPIYGRNILQEDTLLGASPVVLVGHGIWKRRFNSDENIVGDTIILDDKIYTVVGILPPGFRVPSYPYDSDYIIPLSIDQIQADGASPYILVMGRLKPTGSNEQATTELKRIAGVLEREYPDQNKGLQLSVTRLQDHIVEKIKPSILILCGIVGFVLLISCTNVAGLLMVKAATREKELALRLALGATRWQVIRQLLVENVMLSLLGASLGVMTALWSTRLITTLTPYFSFFPRMKDIEVDLSVLCFTLILSLLTGIMFGLLPALRVSNPILSEKLKESVRGTTSSAHKLSTQNYLVVFQFALVMVLTIGAGLMIQSMVRLLSVDPGFDKSNLLTLSINLPGSKYEERDQQIRYFQQVLSNVQNIPGIDSAALDQYTPLAMQGRQLGFVAESWDSNPDDELPAVDYRPISPSYFRTMKIPLLQGRNFLESDREESLLVVIVNKLLAENIWPDQDPLGQRIAIDNENWRTVIGVAEDVRYTNLDTPPMMTMYIPYGQNTISSQWQTLITRTKIPVQTFAPLLRGAVQEVDPQLPLDQIKTIDQFVSKATLQRRLVMNLTTVFSMIAIVLAGIGIYGVISYSVAQRTNGIGTRMALGSQKNNILHMIIRQGMILAIAGVTIGLVIALGLARVLESMLFEISANDPVTFTAVALILVMIALLACYLPALRASKTDPMTALRCE